MNFTVNLADIKKAIKPSIRAISKKVKNKELLNFHLKAKGESLYILASNELICIRVFISATIEEDGEICVDAKLFESILKNIKGKMDLTFKKEDNNLMLYFENSSLSINVTETINYPKYDIEDSYDGFEVNALDIIESIKQTSFCISKNEERPILENVLFDIDGKLLSIVTSDGYRIAHKKSIVNGCEQKEKTLINGESYIELGRVLSNYKKETLKMCIYKDKIIVNVSNGVIFLTSEKGNYFDHNQFFNTNYNTKISFDKETIVEMLEKGNSIAKGMDIKNPSVAMSIVGEEISILAEIDNNNISGIVDGNLFTDESRDIDFSFNLNYLLSGLNSIDSDRIIISYNDNENPCILEGSDNKEYKYMLLPMRFN